MNSRLAAVGLAGAAASGLALAAHWIGPFMAAAAFAACALAVAIGVRRRWFGDADPLRAAGIVLVLQCVATVWITAAGGPGARGQVIAAIAIDLAFGVVVVAALLAVAAASDSWLAIAGVAAWCVGWAAGAGLLLWVMLWLVGTVSSGAPHAGLVEPIGYAVGGTALALVLRARGSAGAILTAAYAAAAALAMVAQHALDAAPERHALRWERDLAAAAASAVLAAILLLAARRRTPEPLPVARPR
jgi:hypothetical protein